ncbi:twinkle homolog protein, chloroplastic/mitochondrial-like isoform X2 [Phalaenopsis equestris]|uniref:twinkle homolog protein, chloroplastic/mitochondrial-like isoform X2 n=1 Tax=Phalaenopsis equestris TaxID=78828 RepID=UPI0009E24641|nr:twinkle homolog protein, chloroplastic/mitochondrial-like isoform X2 [Phalaenopsis equestris]
MPPLRHPLLCNILHSTVLMRSSCHLLEEISGCSAAVPGFSFRFLHRRANPFGNNSRIIVRSLKYSGFCCCRQLSSSRPSEGAVDKKLKRLHEKLGELGVECDPNRAGQYTHSTCPQCGGGDSKEKSFSLFIREDGKIALWSCFRAKCGWKGCVKTSENEEKYIVLHSFGSETSDGSLMRKKYRTISEEDLHLEPLCPELVAYFNARCISIETLQRNVVMQRVWGDEIVIAFTYRRNGKLVSCNYFDVEKNFWQEKDTERIFFGLDDLLPENEIIIVDSEFDKLSVEEAGYCNCISVPNGKASKFADDLHGEHEDVSFHYLWKCKEYFEKVPRIILATNGDGLGQALAEELARRLGKERCWRVKWPKKSATEICKDANEVLNIFGEHVLKEVIEKAEMFPIRGLLNFSNYFTEITDYYNCIQGFELGVSTGWRALDDLYNIVPGELTVITGVPNSGKSEWIDALLCNINESFGWTFALCSMENKVEDHARKLLEKHIKKPFFKMRNERSVERMSLLELEQGKKWLNDTFHIIRCDDDSIPSINWVLTLAKAAVLRHGVRGLVIDPYNELDHQRFSSQTETEYVSRMLTMIKRFAHHHSCHVWFVAHPKQLQNWGGNPPNLYDISGSAHFINKCDNGIVIHRDRVENGPDNRVRVSVRKVRNKVIGRVGDAQLAYDRVTGLFHDIDEPSNFLGR